MSPNMSIMVGIIQPNKSISDRKLNRKKNDRKLKRMERKPFLKSLLGRIVKKIE